MSNQNVLKGALLSLGPLILLTCVSAGASTLRLHQTPSAFVTLVSGITNGTAEKSPGPGLEMQTSGTTGSDSRPSRGVEGGRFWLPDTLETSWTAPDKKLQREIWSLMLSELARQC
ncbi:MAG: hypothetical protein AMJ46_02875 [Latescibacteria bacterium DG_63]|nr:MAG: hypothetical protein AMJ46_02875 [Latescibacteria bacterium DG_63]